MYVIAPITNYLLSSVATTYAGWVLSKCLVNLMFIELVVFMGREMLCSSQIIEIVVSVEF